MRTTGFALVALLACTSVQSTNTAFAQEAAPAESTISPYEGIKFNFIMASVRRDRASHESCRIEDLDARLRTAGKALKKLIGKDDFDALEQLIEEREFKWGRSTRCFGNGPRNSYAQAVSALEKSLENVE